MSELNGQINMARIMPAKLAEAVEGYDAEGNLLDYDPIRGKFFDPDEDARRLDVLAGEINLLERQAKDTFKRTAIEIGARLIEARGIVPEGRWGEWLEANICYSTRKAQQLMQVAEAYDGKALPEAYDKLSFTQIYDLLSAPAEDRDRLAEAAADEGMSTRELKAEIERLNKQHREAQVKIHDLITEQEAGARQLNAEAEARKAGEAENERLKQVADDAVKRANQAKTDLNAAKKEAQIANAEVARLAAEVAAIKAEAPEVKTVEVLPEDVARELDQLRAKVAAMDDKPAQPAPEGPTATDKFKWFYSNQMKSAFVTALELLKAVKEENPKAAEMFAAALVKGCQQLMGQIGGGAA